MKKALTLVKNAPLRVEFSILFSMSGYPDEALSRVFYMKRGEGLSSKLNVQHFD